MTPIGYGVLKDGKPFGIIAVSYSHACAAVKRLTCNDPYVGPKYTIHEIFAGDEVRPTAVSK